MSSVGLTADQSIATRDSDLLAQIDLTRLHRHIAVIMDGNGRWARRRRLPRIAGHRAGAAAVREIVESSSRLGVAALSLYAFSTENWKRPRAEVNTLMTLLREYLHKEIAEIHRNNIRLKILGRYELLPREVLRDLEDALRLTESNTGMVLNVALNYSARTELVDAFRAIFRKVQQSQLSEEDIDEQLIADNLYTRGLADPDLLIRTSGEMRVSNFLLWQIAYAEIWVTDTLWPDFTRHHLYQAILDFQKRERRYGGLGHSGA
ncbi:MAG: isoprenyl transferase [Acidobacteria bacterium]|nr:isoprenyl transferase [Acidobacteriota bacterium]